MNISENLRKAERDLRKAKRKGLPAWAEAFALERMQYVRWKRDHALACKNLQIKSTQYSTALKTLLVVRDMLGFYLCDGLKAGCHAEKSACGIRLKQGEDQPRQEAAIEPVKELMVVRVGGRIEQREVVGKQFARRLDGTEVLIQKEPALKEGEVVLRYLGDDLPLILFVEPSPHPGGKSSGV